MQNSSEMLSEKTEPKRKQLTLPIISLVLTVSPFAIVPLVSALNFGAVLDGIFLYSIPLLVIAGLIIAIISLARGKKVIGVEGKIIAIVSIVVIVFEIILVVGSMLLLYGFISLFKR